MKQHYTHQLDLFEPEPAIEPIEPNRGELVTENFCAKLFLEFLLGKRGSHKTYVHALFDEIHPRHKQSSEGADILTHHLLGFPADEAHAFEQKSHSTLGAIWEKLVTIIYEAAFPGELSNNWDPLVSKLDGDLKPRVGDKVTAEFYFRMVALEIKYRSGSIENVRKQALCAKYLRGMGLSPVMLCLRASPNSAEFRRLSWKVLEGDDALEHITRETGIDVEAVVHIVSRHPRIRKLRERGRLRMYDRLGKYCAGHYSRSGKKISGAIHHEIAKQPDALIDILRRALDAGTLQGAIEATYASASGRARHLKEPDVLAAVMNAGREHFDLMTQET